MDGSEIPDVRFWGMIVRSGQPGTYAIENEHGLMELCHLTNIALRSESEKAKPIYVMLRGPEEEQDYCLGALVPGRTYSFTTDLIISPDSVFSHTGGPGDEVHLTGYRSVSADTILLGDDDDDDGEDLESEDSEDRDFVVDDDDEEEEEDDDEDNINDLRNGQLAKLQAMSKRQRQAQVLGQGSDDDGSDDEDEDLGDADMDIDDEDDDEDEEVDPSRKAAAVAHAQKVKERFDNDKARQKEIKTVMTGAADDAEGEDDFGLGDDDGDDDEQQIGVNGLPADDDDDDDDDKAVAAGLGKDSQGVVKGKHAGATSKAVAGKTEAKKDDAVDADAVATLKQAMQGKGKRPLVQEGEPTAVASKKAKVDAAKSPAKAAAAAKGASTGVLPAHPDKATPVTRKFVEDIVAFLRQNGGEYSMSKLGIAVPRPKDADKLGKVMKTYEGCFRRSGPKGQELMVLKLK